MKKLTLAIVLVMSSYVFAQIGNNVGTIQTINLKSEKDRFSIFIMGDGKLEPNTVVIDNPPRIALDFHNVRNMLYPNVIEAEPNSYIHRIRTSLYAKGCETISRVTIDLKERLDYSLFRTKDGIVLSVSSAGNTNTMSNVTESATTIPSVTTPAPANENSGSTSGENPSASDNNPSTDQPSVSTDSPEQTNTPSGHTVPPLSSTDRVPPPNSTSGNSSGSIATQTSQPAPSNPPATSQPTNPQPIVPEPQPQDPSASISTSTPSQDIVIGSEDLLEVSVFELPQFNTTARVQGDGTITMPLVGSIEVRGLKKKDVETKIALALQAKYVNNANVSVIVKEYKSRQVSVLGEVKSPGAYYVMSQRTLLQLLSEAGGLSNTAGPKCYVFRANAPKIEIDLRDLMLNGNPELNIIIYPGDVVNIPTDVKVVIYVLGAVRLAGAVQLSTAMPVTLLAAIAGAGGTTENAKLSDVKIKRKGVSGENIIKVNLKDIMKGKIEDVPLFEGDVVTVGESFF